MLVKIFYIAGILFLGVALLGSAGMGVWSYNLNNQLEQSHADYQALKSDYNKLDSEYSQAKADYESRLDKAQADLDDARAQDRKSTRLNSSHSSISYAVFCLKKKTNTSPIQASNNSH